MQATQLSAHFMELHLTTSAGTYVKEFVHGDLGRTVPSIGSLLQCAADILQLDVMGVEDQWSRDTTATAKTNTSTATAAAAAATSASAAVNGSDTVSDTTTSNTAEAATAGTATNLVINGQHAGDTDACCKAISNGSTTAASTAAEVAT
jgi:hypothetical protein